MAGVRRYTSAPDAEGTLGGLVNLGQAAELGPILRRALDRSGLCSSDPLCADHEPDSVKLLEPVMPLVYHHHERFDGTGYPDGLRGEEIPQGARIISIADAFESMTSDRPYRKALPLEEAMAEMRYGAGRQFDPRLVEVFMRLAEQGKIDLEWSQSRVIPIADHMGRASTK